MKIRVNGKRKFGAFKESEFKLSQLARENLDSFDMDRRLVLVANAVRIGIGSTTINSCGRTKGYNSTLPGAATTSQHLAGSGKIVRAIDLRSNKVSYKEFENWVFKNHKYLKLLGVKGFGFYPRSNFIHLDVRRQEKISAWGLSEEKLLKIRPVVWTPLSIY